MMTKKLFNFGVHDAIWRYCNQLDIRFLMIVDPVFQTLLKLLYDLYVLPNLKRILSLPLTSPMLFDVQVAR